MELKIYKMNYYYIGINRLSTDAEAARYMGISYEDYAMILRNHGAHGEQCSGDHYFDHEEDAIRALTILESYLIIQRLIN